MFYHQYTKPSFTPNIMLLPLSNRSQIEVSGLSENRNVNIILISTNYNVKFNE